jgi:hypothetical protein
VESVRAQDGADHCDASLAALAQRAQRIKKHTQSLVIQWRCAWRARERFCRR